MDASTTVPSPVNEPNLSYAPGTPERDELKAAIDTLQGQTRDLPAWIAGQWQEGQGAEIPVVQPHDHQHVLGMIRNATTEDARRGVDAAIEAGPAWRDLPFDERAAVFLRAAELLAGPWRQRLNAATVLGQGKTAVQAEIDSACELIDFWRFNVHYASQVLAEQPVANSPGIWNRLDHRPLEGFVYAITPFNFTAIAGNLPTAPALMGNTVVWKPSPTQQLAATLTMELLTEAGLPPGVINMLPGDGLAVSEVALASPHLAGIHFTGSTATFQHLWREVGGHLDRYRTYPRLVGETGGKDFVIAHPSADPEALRVALLRGAFDYSGQKCSAASRAYVPRSVWERMGDDLVSETESLSMGDPRDFRHFLGAVIDERAFAKHRTAIERAHATDSLDVVAGGSTDDEVGWFVRPTVLLGQDPSDEAFTTEYFGPILAVHVFDDTDLDRVVEQAESATPYGLTGAIFARDREAVAQLSHRLRFAAGNFYVNDKPTGAVVGQQPFGGGRGSGTNDKAGARQNLMRWTSTRSVKETFDPPHDHRYPHQG